MTEGNDMEFEPRRATKGATYAYTTPDGSTHELAADDDGVIWPQDAAGVALLDVHDLPVARKAIAEAAAEREEK